MELPMNAFKNRYWLLIMLLCTACGNNAPAKQENTPAERKLQTTPVLLEDITRDIKGLGLVTARQEVELSAEIAGRVVTVHRDIGDEVKTGNVIVELESEDYQIMVEKRRAQLKKAQAQLKKSNRDKTKADTLFSDGVLSDTDHDAASLGAEVSSADVQLAQAELKAAEKDYRDTQITAPYNGTIALRSIETGHYITPGQCLLTLVDLSGVTIVINVSERDIPKISHTSPVRVTIDSLPGETFTGTVKTIALKAEATSRSFPVEVWVKNPGRRILPGMIARVDIRSARPEPLLTIPQKAVSSMHGETTVRIMLNGAPLMRVVDLGAILDDRVIVRAGLAAGDLLVLPDTM
jgi:membrane fusion protein (multidrug efflux system)